MRRFLIPVLCLACIAYVGDCAVHLVVAACADNPSDPYFYKGSSTEGGHLWAVIDQSGGMWACYRTYRCDSGENVVFDGTTFQNKKQKLINSGGCSSPCSYVNTSNLWLEGCEAGTSGNQYAITCYPDIVDPE